MTYALSWPLQEGIFQVLTGAPPVAAVLGNRIYDAPPPLEGDQAVDGLYALIGDEAVEDWSTGSDRGARHVVTVAIYAPRHGFGEAKRAAGAVSDAMLGGAFALSRGRVVNVRFLDGRTRREDKNALRRIDLRFGLVVEDTL